MDWYAINIELSQATNDSRFADATLKRAAQECAKLCRQYSIPAIWLERVDQTGEVPSGITSHDLTDNGRRLGKTDVGQMFPGERFMDMVRDKMGNDKVQTIRVTIPFGSYFAYGEFEADANKVYVATIRDYGQPGELLACVCNIVGDRVYIARPGGSLTVDDVTFTVAVKAL